RLCWPCWLRVLATFGATAQGEENTSLLLGRLLALHRGYLNHFLGRNTVAAARRHWGYVEGLVPLAAAYPPAPAPAIAEAVAGFRTELAADFLTATREVMKTGGAP